jgi:hypothetical protein
MQKNFYKSARRLSFKSTDLHRAREYTLSWMLMDSELETKSLTRRHYDVEQSTAAIFSLKTDVIKTMNFLKRAYDDSSYFMYKESL